MALYTKSLRYFTRVNGDLHEERNKQFDWLSRAPEQLVRLALVFSVARHAWSREDNTGEFGKPIITVECIEKALAVLRWCSVSARKIRDRNGGQATSPNRREYLEIKQKVLEKVGNAGKEGISSTKLTQNIRNTNAKEIRKILYELREEERILTVPNHRSITAYPVN